ncbi:MAG: hypothetical protein LBF97_03805 [Elusimicrobiota bacterium]|jgi:hypothetical protein|nr:hypothetical protein [Elusimicrobiota bacterium]
MILWHSEENFYTKWNEMNLFEQMANIGSEISRSIKWKEKGNIEISNRAFERALELFIFTISCKKNKFRLKEICRAKECFIDYFIGDNQYGFTKESWMNYFDHFAIAARNVVKK